jgi:hypothetical protein
MKSFITNLIIGLMLFQTTHGIGFLRRPPVLKLVATACHDDIVMIENKINMTIELSHNEVMGISKEFLENVDFMEALLLLIF